jgi:hypothetical protein
MIVMNSCCGTDRAGARSGNSVRLMPRKTTLLWTLVAFFAGHTLFGFLRRATEDSSKAVAVLVQVAALAWSSAPSCWLYASPGRRSSDRRDQLTG